MMAARKQTLIVVGLLLAYLAIQVAGLSSVGLTDDDDFYIPAGKSYAVWLGKAASFQKDAFSKAAIDAAFKINNEHPPVAKYVFGVCEALFRGLLGPIDSARLGAVLFSTLAAAMILWMAIFQLGFRRGIWAGGLGMAFLLFLPRFYFHSHAATLDVPVAGMYLLTAALALRAESKTWAAVAAGIAYGLATATKLNAPFLVVAYILWVLFFRQKQASSLKSNFLGLKLPAIPQAIVYMALLGPVVFFLSWPWMWFDIVGRVNSYVAFHLNHYGIYFLYFGRVFEKDPFAPWHASVVMAFTTIPLATSFLAIFGTLRALPELLSRLLGVKVSAQRGNEADLVSWCLLHGAVSVAVVAFSGGAKYGGAKLFMPFFPFWCLLAGYGVLRLCEWAQELSLPKYIPAAATALALASSLSLQLKFGEYALSQYNALAGGLRGATAAGFERQYYDIAFRDLVKYLSQEAPRGHKVHFLPNNWEYVRTYKWYKKAGLLRSDIKVTQGEQQADWVVITHERRFSRYSGDFQRYRMNKLVKEKQVDGTPIWSIYQRR